jgi:hypothetical protein|tara:strand:- start:235 stop:855 length:621 start_codon:yes stop_codon:yes gene_type:complete
MSNIVYIFINQSMPDMVKIGITDNVERRVKELSGSSGVPLPFECYYAVKVSEDAKKLEKKIHEGFDKQRVRREREFFYTSPENAKSILELLEIMGGENVTPKDDIVESQEEKQALDEARKLRTRFNFSMLDIKPGEILKFKKDNSIVCEVHDETQVKFRDKVTSLSNSADIILKEMGYEWLSVQGPRWWVYEGKTLSELRNERESI